MRVGDPEDHDAVTCELMCSGGGTRTHNLRINSPPLCQLSYPGRCRESTNGGFPALARAGSLTPDRSGRSAHEGSTADPRRVRRGLPAREGRTAPGRVLL